MSESIPVHLHFPPIAGLTVRRDCDGDALSSDFGPLILGFELGWRDGHGIKKIASRSIPLTIKCRVQPATTIRSPLP